MPGLTPGGMSPWPPEHTRLPRDRSRGRASEPWGRVGARAGRREGPGLWRAVLRESREAGECSGGLASGPEQGLGGQQCSVLRKYQLSPHSSISASRGLPVYLHRFTGTLATRGEAAHSEGEKQDHSVRLHVSVSVNTNASVVRPGKDGKGECRSGVQGTLHRDVYSLSGVGQLASNLLKKKKARFPGEINSCWIKRCE